MRILFLASAFPLLYSCHEQGSSTLADYDRLACSFQQLSKERDSVQQSVLAPLEAKWRGAKNQLFLQESQYDDQLDALHKKIDQVNLRYTEQYVTISQKHEARFGHRLTADYNKQIERIEHFRDQQINRYNQQVAVWFDLKSKDTLIHFLDVQIKQWENDWRTRNPIRTPTLLS